MASQNINASFLNGENHGLSTPVTPSVQFQAGYFVVPTGLGGVIPYSATETLFMTVTGTFVLGETVTQATSGATGIVVDPGTNFGSPTVGITIGTVTGTFDTTHLVTGGTSAATGTPTSVLVNNKILGLSNSIVTTASYNYAVPGQLINVSTPVNIEDFLLIPVSNGTAVASMAGSYVNVDPANPGQVDVTTLSRTTGQIYITKVVSATQIKGAIANKVA